MDGDRDGGSNHQSPVKVADVAVDVKDSPYARPWAPPPNDHAVLERAVPHTGAGAGASPPGEEEQAPGVAVEILGLRRMGSGVASTSGRPDPPIDGDVDASPAKEVQAEEHKAKLKKCARSLSSLPQSDTALAVAPLRARIAIFFLLCQAVQAFMSYDGGATPASLDTIQEEMNYSWSPGEFGVLGSIDKIGMTATSMLWGRCLQRCAAKPILIFGLLLNTACTAVFGSLRSKGLMYAAKFAMGASQSLQGVWATVWTVTMAPPDRKTMWLGLGAVSAGIGNGLGTGVAGFGTANGLPYAFAFQFQAAVLALLWLVTLATPGRWLVMRIPASASGLDGALPDRSPFSSARSDASRTSIESVATDAPSTLEQLKEVWHNKVYCWTCLAISTAMFEMSGIQFLWVRVFVEVWDMSKNSVTLAFLLVSGLGGGLGIACGPAYIDRHGGFNSPLGVVKSLKILRKLSFLSGFAGLLGVACLYSKLRSKDTASLSLQSLKLGDWGDGWLWGMFVAVFLIWAARSACIPALCGINVEVIPDNIRTFASGTEMALRNILGYALGPLLPGLVMNIVGGYLYWAPENARRASDTQLCCGLGFVFLINLVDSLVLGRAVRAARRTLKTAQERALALLREAFQEEDIVALERAVAFAKNVDLQKRSDGAAVMGMSHQAIGAYHARGSEEAFQGSIAVTATREELQQRVIELEREISQLKKSHERPPEPSKSRTYVENSSTAGAVSSLAASLPVTPRGCPCLGWS